MKKAIKFGTILIVAVLAIFLTGCQNTDDSQTTYTVTFVDYYGNEITSFTCDKGEVCPIVTPDDPLDIGDRYFTRWSVWESEYADINSDTTIKPIYTLDNVAFTVFTREVMFYSLFILTGIVVALLMGLRECKRLGIKQDDLIDGFLWTVPVAIIGARLWYVVFEWDQFVGDTFSETMAMIFGFHNGVWFDFHTYGDYQNFGFAGLAIHGALFTAILCVIIHTKVRKMDLMKVLDMMAVGFIIAQAFGRWGNFFNQEAHGGLVGGLLANGDPALTVEQQYNYLRYTLHIPEFIVNNMYIEQGLHEVVDGYYHPTFFYESTINLVGFAIMLVLRRLKKAHFGDLFAFYLVWYGALRIFIEMMRTDPLEFELFGITFKSAIVTSSIMILIGILISVYTRIKRKDKTYGTIPGCFGCPKQDQNQIVTENA
ncbi:MAG TPA: prolipoprotein diacylglyceryl transferase [Bacillota bacterium]|mgnify:CR=1 FL=1|nr:prolipoprotein diacylglyceryl transferase [Bacillota bacterium]HPF42865.1 prolipoprotein diacylglyceryl transferase [Bacillota bacterium]HPJ86101.1 prolipoprotein diacylglyceryl transferase [Bacillota bacterium]HPQ61498.1 prolipoprotein diacylglyceryl transferase [Bacillota bacterium]HRX92063.1 prolipoprotein diacylglyceryl transferase [Candidatus Izemoplasmatales bacterium]